MTAAHGGSDPATVVEQLLQAINQHDLDALTECFEPDYVSESPAHPGRAFRGREQMRENWSRMFENVPDIEAALVRSCVSEGDTAWAEWDWTGTRADGGAFTIRGATVLGVRRDRIAWMRHYMEPVQEDDAGARQALAGR